ncbi:MAG: hypothetical protein WBA67_04945, partial [Jannaschia sp.]
MSDVPARPRKRRALFRVVSVLLLLFAGGAFGAAAQLTRGALTLPDWAVTRIEARATRDLSGADLSIGQVALAYDVDDQALRFRVRQVVLSDGTAEVLTLPETRLTLDGPSLLRGKVRPRAIDLAGLALDVERDASGRISLSLGSGGGGGVPRDWPSALAALDGVLALPVVADLDTIEITGITLQARDAVTGIEQQITEGTVTLRREGGGARLTLTLELPVGGGRRSVMAMTLIRAGQQRGAQATIALADLPISYLARSLPKVPALSLVTGNLSASGAFTVSEDGQPGPVRGRLETRDLRVPGHPDLALDRAVLAFD